MKKYLFLITSFFTTLVASGVTYYVVPNGAGSKNGTSWANAYADVQTAIDSTYNVGGGEVWIAKGTYKHGSAMTMKNGVAIYGGFAGTETSKDQRVSGNNTILDGEDKYRVFYNNYTESNPLTNSAKLDNVTIQNGYANDGNDNSISTADYGAGMYNKYASPEITNCTFTTNNSASYGGGMYNSGSTPSLTNCTFSDNSAGSGGGMENYSSSPVLTNCTFSANNANYGGGMYNEYSSNPVLTNCTFSANSAGSGGGMYNGYSSSPALTNCTFSNNNSYDGGGICNEDSTSPKLTNCILWGNTASFRDNEIHNDGSNNKPTIDTCIIKGGYSSSYGTYTNIITADPKLIPLGNYGGSVQTCPVSAGSSAIGEGKAIESVTTDARGFTRSTTPTIGACESIFNSNSIYIETQEGYLKYSSSYEFTLNALSEGTNLTYQWYKDGKKIEGATYSSYKTSQSAGTSKYTVEVSDGTTTITSSELAIETVDTPRYYVSTIGNSSNDGLIWATAKSDVQEAIDLASEYYGSEVWIAKGTYKHGSAMTMKNGVAIYGGFAGTETSKDQRVSGNNTILDGEGKYRVFHNNYTESNPLTNSAKLDNVTIQNGYTSGFGAGMSNNYASPEITNCTFTMNKSASSSGGGMYNGYSSSPVLTNCTFSANNAYYGGGICNEDSTSPKLTNCILWGNTASFRDNEIHNDGSNNKPIIDTCIIKGGYSSYGTYTNIITADPKLLPLGNYGGSVKTCPVGAGSSAIGAGKVVDGITTDARGIVRSTTAPTIGAYEYVKVKRPF